MIELDKLLERLEYRCETGVTDVRVRAVRYDSREIEPGDLFVCIKGNRADSHDLIGEIVSRGAKVIVAERKIQVPDGVTVIQVRDSRYALALISASYFGYPAEKMKLIGVTGTKGKTTVAYMLREMLKNAGYQTGLMGTIVTAVGDEEQAAGNTTPESYLIQELLAKMVEAGCGYVIMEVSSQGLKLQRTAGILFDIGIFTNLGPDHIGPAEHKDFAEYAQCKSRLFRQCRVGVVNGDDEYLDLILRGHTCEVVTYGMGPENAYLASDLELYQEDGAPGIQFQVSGRLESRMKVDIPGKFSVYNAMAAIAACAQLKLPADVMGRALKTVKVKGRVEVVPGPWDFTVMIDYAHNAMSLQSLLTTLREYEPHRLVCLFGCGGNRSKLRRYEMGEMSGKLSDFTVITSDNPRYEKPEAIIADIRTGMEKTDGAYIEIPDRREAIAWALRHGQKGDILILAGKGHEDYQEICGVKYPMDERVIIREIIQQGECVS